MPFSWAFYIKKQGGWGNRALRCWPTLTSDFRLLLSMKINAPSFSAPPSSKTVILSCRNRIFKIADQVVYAQCWDFFPTCVADAPTLKKRANLLAPIPCEVGSRFFNACSLVCPGKGPSSCHGHPSSFGLNSPFWQDDPCGFLSASSMLADNNAGTRNICRHNTEPPPSANNQGKETISGAHRNGTVFDQDM